jgi:AcrR family transcriptional regulator
VSEQHLAARRQQILDAAVALFSERGFARTSMSDVVRESGLSMGAVYRYFPSKADLVIAVGEGHGGEVDGTFPAEHARDLLARLAAEVGSGSSHARLSVQVWGGDRGRARARRQGRAHPPAARGAPGTAPPRREAGPAPAGRRGRRPGRALGGHRDGRPVAARVPVDERRFVAALTRVVDPPATPGA